MFVRTKPQQDGLGEKTSTLGLVVYSNPKPLSCAIVAVIINTTNETIQSSHTCHTCHGRAMSRKWKVTWITHFFSKHGKFGKPHWFDSM